MRFAREFFRLKFNPWNPVLAAGALACLGTITGFLGRLWWGFDLTAHFRLQYAVGLTLLALALLAARRWKAARTPAPGGPLTNRSSVERGCPHPREAMAWGPRRQPSALHIPGSWQAAAVFAVVAAINWAIVIPYLWTGRAPAAPTAPTLRVLQLNVHTQNQQHDRARSFIREANADVVVLEIAVPQ
jgi:endonuclease/exonuclease/phosphatase (EEP) superfamily protein YafD